MHIVITGSTKGIGKAIAELFATHRAHVTILARTASDLETQKRNLMNLGASEVFAISADLSLKKDRMSAVEAILKQQQAIDVLVNNAGVFIPGQIISESEDQLETMIQTNLYSAYDITRGLLPLIRKGKHPLIVNMCSIASFVAYPNGGSYAISKFALLGFSKCLRAEVMKEGIRVTALMPGATFTPAWHGSGVPEDRMIPAQDVADVVYQLTTLSAKTVVEEIVLRPQLGDL